MNALRAEFLPIISYELSLIHRQMGDLAAGKMYADRAIEEALKTEQQRYLGEAYSARARIAALERDFEKSVDLYHLAIQAHEKIGNRSDCVVILLNLASDYATANRLGAARRAIRAAQKLEREIGTSRAARVEYLLGEIDFAEGHASKASSHWMKAVEIAKENADRMVQFKSEYRLFERAVTNRNTTVLNALGRRLSRLAPWIPSSEPDVALFRELYALHRKPKQRGVAAPQHGHSHR
jgi:tetratricopeptide (TPR) repeat protein